MEGFVGKVVVVIGVGLGIGQVLVIELVCLGVKVVISDVDIDGLVDIEYWLKVISMLVKMD